MHVPGCDRPLDEAEWRDFVTAEGFGQLIASGRDRDVAVVVPLQFVLDADVVLCHVVAQNPVVAALREQPRAVLSVAGDWAFVPSHWKVIGTEDPSLGIPTTYYAAVQLEGDVELVTRGGALAALLRRQLAALQPGVAVADPGVAHAARLGAIVGVRLRVDAVRAKCKFGGNVDEPHRRAVLEHLTERDGRGDREAADHLRRRVRGTGSTRSAFERP